MTLAYPLLAEPILFAENKVSVLVIENATELRSVLLLLQRQCSGDKGEFVLAEDGTPMEFSRVAVLVTDPFSLEFDSRKLLTKLTQEACTAAEEFADNFHRIMVELNELGSKISLQLGFEAAFSAVESQDDLIKLMGFRVDTESLSFAEQVLEFVKLQRSFCGKKLVIFYNLKSVLSESELCSLYQSVRYEKLNLLLIESELRKQQKEFENTIVVDKDLCVF